MSVIIGVRLQVKWGARAIRASVSAAGLPQDSDMILDTGLIAEREMERRG